VSATDLSVVEPQSVQNNVRICEPCQNFDTCLAMQLQPFHLIKGASRLGSPILGYGSLVSSMPSKISTLFNGTNLASDASQYVVYPRVVGSYLMAQAINASIYRIVSEGVVEAVESPLAGIESWIVTASAAQ